MLVFYIYHQCIWKILKKYVMIGIIIKGERNVTIFSIMCAQVRFNLFLGVLCANIVIITGEIRYVI